MKINTKIIFTISALFLGILGICLSFLPQEIAEFLKLPTESYLFLQLTGALYFGFAMVNWMVKGSTIGGIYNRPIAIGNFSHFIIGALALVKFASGHLDDIPVLILTAIYAVFAIIFSLIVFTHPLKES